MKDLTKKLFIGILKDAETHDSYNYHKPPRGNIYPIKSNFWYITYNLDNKKITHFCDLGGIAKEVSKRRGKNKDNLTYEPDDVMEKDFYSLSVKERADFKKLVIRFRKGTYHYDSQ